ncbi:MAG: hypothetical protein RR540_00130 [Oscillospiraceae bacterium]
MSDFASEAAGSALKITNTAIELLAKLFKFIFNRNNGSGKGKWDNKLKKEEAIQLKNERLSREATRKAVVKYNGRGGEIAQKQLERMAMSGKASDQPYFKTIDTLDEKDFQKVCEKMKMRGIVWCSLNGNNKRVLRMREGDKEAFNEILQEITTEKLMEAKQNELDELLKKGKLTPEEQARADEIMRDLDGIKAEECAKENAKSNEETFENFANGEKEQSRTFDDTVNHFTDRGFQKNGGKPYYACERTNPNSYMEMCESKDIFHDKEYRKTDFKVYKDGVEQKSDICKDGKFNDARFEGRPKYFWSNVRKEMKQKGEFSDDIAVFANKKDFEKYRTAYEKAVKESTINDKNVSFSNIQKQCDEQLSANGAAFDEKGTLVNVKTKEPITEERAAKIENIQEKTRFNECLIIAAQAKNYRELAEAKMMLSLAKSDLKSSDVISDEEISEINKTIKQSEEKIVACEKNAVDLQDKRDELSAVEAVNVVDNDNRKEFGKEAPEEEKEDFVGTMEYYQKEIDKTKNENQMPSGEKIAEGKVNINETTFDRGDR